MAFDPIFPSVQWLVATCVSIALVGQWGSEWGSIEYFASTGIPWGFSAGPLQCLCDETGWVQPRILVLGVQEQGWLSQSSSGVSVRIQLLVDKCPSQWSQNAF